MHSIVVYSIQEIPSSLGSCAQLTEVKKANFFYLHPCVLKAPFSKIIQMLKRIVPYYLIMTSYVAGYDFRSTWYDFMSLHDCLACSGCITTAETVMLEQQSTGVWGVGG